MQNQFKMYLELFSSQHIMVAGRILDGVVRNVCKNDVGKLAAWTSVSHIEKSPKKTETP